MRSTPRAVRTGRRRVDVDSPGSRFAALGFGTFTAIAVLLTGACANPDEEQSGPAVELQFGEFVDVGGVAMAVSGIVRIDEDVATDDVSNVYLLVRAENRSELTKPLPGLEVSCLRRMAGAVPGAGDAGSTYKPHTDLPPGERAEGTLAVGVSVGCESPVVWPEGSSAAFWRLSGSIVQEPAEQLAQTAEQLAHEMIDTLDVSDEVKTCMHEAVSKFQLSEEDAHEFGDLDAVADKADQGDERALQIMGDFETALAACN